MIDQPFREPATAPDLHPAAISAIERNAELQAELTAAWLTQFQVLADKRGDVVDFRGLPAGYLLELGALCQLQQWEMEGIRALLPTDLPTFESAVAELFGRVNAGPRQFYAVASATLSARVVSTWVDHFGWDARPFLQAEVLIGAVDEDEFVDAMAELIWSMRRQPKTANQN